MSVQTNVCLSENPAVQQMIDYLEDCQKMLLPADKSLVIDIYGDMPQQELCAQLCADWSAYQELEGYYREKNISFSCKYVETFVSVLYTELTAKQYEIHLELQ